MLSQRTTIVTMSSTIATVTAFTPKYMTHYIRSWHEYQRNTPSHLHSIEHYNAACEKDAEQCEAHVMLLRDNVTKINGWYWCIGWPAQNCADTDGYVDVRTGKKYTLEGETSFFKDIGK